MSKLFHPKFCVLKAAHFNKKNFFEGWPFKTKKANVEKGCATAAKYYSSLFFSKALQ